MKTNHTPGPWIYDSGCFYADCQLDRRGQTSEAPIAEMLKGRPDDAIGNANLIEASPEMLKELINVVDVLSSDTPMAELPGLKKRLLGFLSDIGFPQ